MFQEERKVFYCVINAKMWGIIWVETSNSVAQYSQVAIRCTLENHQTPMKTTESFLIMKTILLESENSITAKNLHNIPAITLNKPQKFVQTHHRVGRLNRKQNLSKAGEEREKYQGGKTQTENMLNILFCVKLKSLKAERNIYVLLLFLRCDL